MSTVLERRGTGRPAPVGSRVSSGVSAANAISSPVARAGSVAKVSTEGLRNWGCDCTAAV